MPRSRAAQPVCSTTSFDARARFAESLATFRPYLLHIAEEELDTDLRSKGAPSDVVQDTFVAACRHRDQFHGRSVAELRGWLRAILRYQIAHLRRRYRSATHSVRREIPRDRLPDGFDPPDRAVPPADEIQRREEAQRLSGLLEQLSEPEQRIVAGRVESEESFAEIGERLGMSADAARMTWNRALERLRGQLEMDGRFTPRPDAAPGLRAPLPSPL